MTLIIKLRNPYLIFCKEFSSAGKEVGDRDGIFIIKLELRWRAKLLANRAVPFDNHSMLCFLRTLHFLPNQPSFVYSSEVKIQCIFFVL